MSDPREPMFAAARKAAGGALEQKMVPIIHAALDAALIPRTTGEAEPVVYRLGPIAMIDAALLRVANPDAGDLQQWVEPIREACAKFEIDTIRRIAAFVTTLAHEGGFKVGVRENMNYSAERLAEVWPSRFRGPNALARAIERKPQEIANHVYANRMGNGPPESGDGWRFRGNGPPQLTGRANHEAFAKAMGMTLDEAVQWIGTVEGGVMAAAWFWEENDVNRLADTPGVADETKRINGGAIGLEERRAIFNRLVDAMLEREGGQ